MKQETKDKIRSLQETAKIHLHLVCWYSALKRDYYKRLADFDGQILKLCKERQELIINRLQADEKIAAETAALKKTKLRIKELKRNNDSVETLKAKIARLKKQIAETEAILAED
jgi:hypothetical protein